MAKTLAFKFRSPSITLNLTLDLPLNIFKLGAVEKVTRFVVQGVLTPMAGSGVPRTGFWNGASTLKQSYCFVQKRVKILH